jgi:hypothetical protein
MFFTDSEVLCGLHSFVWEQAIQNFNGWQIALLAELAEQGGKSGGLGSYEAILSSVS